MEYVRTLRHIQPRAPWLLRRVLRPLSHLERGDLHITLPGGGGMVFQGPQFGPSAEIKVLSYQLARRLLAGDIGLAEAYIHGDWETSDLVSVLLLLAANQRVVDGGKARLAWRLAQSLHHGLKRNTRTGARRNILAHYDLGNNFYAAWLDPSMTYSSAYGLERGLARGQQQKYARLSQIAGVASGERVLEIGCGWGAYVEYAARLGAHVTGLTISPAQFQYARQRVIDAGIENNADIAMRDYRDETGMYDRIISIEMFEAVGEAYWTNFFDVAVRCLRPGGTAAFQIITIDESFFPRYRAELDFIRYYIFPGGMLPTHRTLLDLGAKNGLELIHDENFGADYAATCRIWRSRFLEAWPQIAALGFDEKFRRLWLYYLCYCEAAFAAGIADVRHIAFRKPS
jgi:cyclopropane-fatty-acyl-phospholipid synthase